MTAGGRRRAEPTSSLPSPVLILGGLFAGAVVSALAWYFLVNAAIDFGSEARNGRGIAWLFCVLATAGAIACMVMLLVLGTRGFALLGLGSRGPSAGTHGRRAK
ncbi:MAG TPA: hypothetical protein VFK52_13075 [Nocardioidaceae bacterium]|nr:hypothetical protein [Nocardioidaceae bacterium]